MAGTTSRTIRPYSWSLSPFLARALVFITSAAVLILEILAGRLLAPHLGISLEVF
ncbi:MAG TPA: spermidine synthase, partial [Acidimicrobiia bacterium]